MKRGPTHDEDQSMRDVIFNSPPCSRAVEETNMLCRLRSGWHNVGVCAVGNISDGGIIWSMTEI